MAAADSLIGQIVSHYRIIEKLDCGGMSVVYKSHDTRLDRFVTIKFLPVDLVNDLQALSRRKGSLAPQRRSSSRERYGRACLGPEFASGLVLVCLALASFVL